MTIEELATVLTPITDLALNPQNEIDVVRAGIVLSALLGAIEGGEIDHKVLGILTNTARHICAHRAGLHWH